MLYIKQDKAKKQKVSKKKKAVVSMHPTAAEKENNGNVETQAANDTGMQGGKQSKGGRKQRRQR